MTQRDQLPQNLRTPDTQPVQLHLPDFVAPDPTKPIQLPLWPEGMVRMADARPDPASPDLLAAEEPDTLSYPSANARMMPEPEYAPEVVMRQRPGELDRAALSVALGSPDDAELPSGLAYPQLYTDDDEMTRRKRHFALLELGLEQDAKDEQ